MGDDPVGSVETVIDKSLLNWGTVELDQDRELEP